ncbi:unnamed protein product [Spodoptera littoralis]|uniref:Uncharacterized protein n=1 Tax=Spodoptera littoralis TaxID=7109 RepID=A0A9P0HY04_SPOLI|nr:unnamed protein product [Spodoptera littoralis]CAH1636481.1 unnamed protein product [Spodoptera littoralis]
MKRLMIFVAALAVAVAKPELYKEKEDFQFSRSSTDEGSKSGFYGAQRGNMGGNYERAHNMDALAQNQMSGLVRQVEGELGSGARTRTGSVYTAANSRGTYGSGHYDLSNLAGRNFQEGASYGNSHSQSSLASSSAYNAAGYSSSQSQNSRHSGYQAGGHTGINLQSDDLQTLDTTRGAGQHEYGGRQSGYSSGYNAQSGYQQHSTYDSSNSNLQSGGYGSNVHTRLISATPVRIIVRPGTRVAIPIGAQTYDIAQGSQVNHNSLNSEAEVLSNADQRAVYRPSNGKHYESSYNYHKEWEKHDTIPATVATSTSTDNPFPINSELYEDTQARTSNAQYDARRADSQRAHSSSVYGGYNAVKSGQSRLNYDAQRSGQSIYNNVNGFTAAGSNHHDSTSDSRLNGYNVQTQFNAGRYGAAVDSNSLTQAVHNAGSNADLNSQVETLDTKPKSYQSSYSYHKSWERQGDPYVIKPASGAYYDGQSSQRLSSSLNQGYVSGSHYQHSHQRGEDCDENGHIRVARSYNIDQFQDQQQQSQKLEDLGQQVENFGQQVENLDQQTGQQVEDFGQQSQTAWGQEAGQQTQNLWDNVEDLSQQSHNQWDNMQQTWSKFEDFGQKPQDLNKQTSNLDQKVQNDQEQRRQGTELKNNTQDQQTHDIWDMSNIRQDDQEQSSIFDQNHEQHKFSGQESVSQSGYQNTQQSNSQQNNANFYNFHKESSFHETHHESNQWHMYTASNSRDQTMNTNINTHTIDTNSPSAPLASIWDKLGNLEPTLLTNKLNKSEENNFSQTQNNQGYSMQTDSHPKVDETVQGIFHHTQEKEKEISVEKSNITRNGHESSHDMGRGDISSEDLIDSKPDKHPFDTSVSMETTQNKNIKEVEVPPQSDLSVLGSVVQKSHDQVNSNNKTTGQSNINVFSENKHLTEQSRDLKEQRTIENSGQVRVHSNEFKSNENKVITESQNNGQNKLEQKPVQHIGQGENLEQKNLEDFSQHQNIEQQSSQDFFQQHNLDQQNLQDFGQQHNLENFDQHENMEQQNLQDFGQHVNMEQQNLQEFGQHVNMEQQNLEDFGQQQNMDQQNLQDFGQHENMDQQNLQDFSHQQNMEQESLQEFGHQADTQQQNIHDLEHKENLDQQNVHDFGQHADSQKQRLHNIWQQADLQKENVTHDLEQKENLDQQNVQDFGQQVDSQQQSLHNIWQQADLQQQSVHDLEQKENKDQQNIQDFGQQVDSQQQSLHNIWQQADLQQQSVHDLEDKDNLDQQNIQEFGQQTDSQQQSLHNIWQQTDLQQQNVHDFGQQENLDVEPINHNGRSNNYHEKQEHDITLPTHKQTPTYPSPPKELEEVVEVKKHNYDLHSISSSTTVVAPVETTTEKPGFWKSIGNKFSNAKNKIASWF